MKKLILGFALLFSVAAQAKGFIELKSVLYSKNSDGISDFISSKKFQREIQSNPNGIYLVSWVNPNLWECRSSLTQINSDGKIRTEYPEFIGGSNGAYAFYLGEKSEFDSKNANILSFANSCLSQVYQQGGAKYDSMADGTAMELVDANGIVSTSGFYIKKMKLSKSIVSYGIVLKNN